MLALVEKGDSQEEVHPTNWALRRLLKNRTPSMGRFFEMIMPLVV
jgi:hypothetical protein